MLCWLISQVAKPYAIESVVGRMDGRNFYYSLTFSKALSLRSSSSWTLPLTAATIRSCTRFSEESRRRLTFGNPDLLAKLFFSL